LLKSETTGMASQPEDCSEDITTNNLVNFYELISFRTGLRHPYDNFALNENNGHLNTPESERRNPFIPSTSPGYIYPSNGTCKTDFDMLWSMNCEQVLEVSISSEGMDEDIVSSILDGEVNGNGMKNNSDQQMDAHAQELIAETSNHLRNAVDEISIEKQFSNCLSINDQTKRSMVYNRSAL